MADDTALISREELLGGLPARRASTLLFAIESRTAHLVVRAQQAMARHLSERSAEARERAFLEAMAQGRNLPLQPTIQNLERHAPEWADLVPEEPGVRAALARLLGQKYTFMARDAPALRQALGLDSEQVRQSFLHSYGAPLETIYAASVGWRERLRWMWAGVTGWLEGLPPFWMVFVLTVTEIVGAGILALPIALAGVGPLPGVALLVGLGLVNVLTIAAMSEAFARTGSVRYGQAFFGRLVAEYLGPAGSALLMLVLLLYSLGALIAYYVGVANTLAGASGLPAVAWAGLLFLVGLYFLRRESLSATVASALLIGAINLGLLVIITLLALPHVRAEHLLTMHLPFVGGRPFDPSILGLVFGICLAAFFGHTAIGNCAAVVLRRDPSGRAMIWGAIAAMLLVIALNCLWVVAVNGALPQAALLEQPGTSLTPLAATVGPAVLLFGAVYVVLGMGMASIHYSLALYNQVCEWLPAREAGGAGNPLRRFAASRGGRFILGSAPVAAIFLLIEWLLWTRQESFAGPLGFLGTIGAALLAGVFPVLMLVASRRRGEYGLPAAVGWFGHPAVVAGVYVLFLMSIVLHGTVIWDNPLQRVAALVVAAVTVGLTVDCFRRGAFRSRAVIELRVERQLGGQACVRVMADGAPLSTDIHAHGPDGERHMRGAEVELPSPTSLTVQLPATPARELKLWAHALTPEGRPAPLPAQVELDDGAEIRRLDLGRAGGLAVLPIGGAGYRVRITLSSH